jgi:hypothetical protein
VDFRTFCPVPVHGRGAVHDDRAGTQRGFLCGVPSRGQRPKPSQPTLIPGGLERVRLRCRDVPSSPGSGPVYGGPCIGSVLAPIQYHARQFLGRKVFRTRFLTSRLAALVEAGASALPVGEPPRGQVVRDARRLVITEDFVFRTTPRHPVVQAMCYISFESQRSPERRNALLNRIKDCRVDIEWMKRREFEIRAVMARWRFVKMQPSVVRVRVSVPPALPLVTIP